MFNPAKGFLVGLTSYQFSFQSYAKRSCVFFLKLTLFGQTFLCSKLVSHRSYDSKEVNVTRLIIYLKMTKQETSLVI